MPRWLGLGSQAHVRKDFVEADLDTAFALLYAAEIQGGSGDRTNALRAIEEAEKAIGDGEQRSAGLKDCDRERFLLQLQRTRGVIDGVRSTLG